MDAVLSKRSPAYKERNLWEKTISRREAIDLILEDPNLMRRPLVLTGSRSLLGYDAKEYETLR